MAPQSKTQRTLQPLNTNWNDRSHSSIVTASDAATFHSAHGQTSALELQSITPRPVSSTKVPVSPTIEAIKMSRQDSGYADTPHLTDSPTISSRRTSLSTSSTRRNSPSKARRRTNTTAASSSRPLTKRATRSSTQTSQISHPSAGRPGFQSRHTTPTPYLTSVPANQFFQFPSLAPEPTTPPKVTPPPPPTVQYWTSDSTRRLEYAAIDAASRGVRGFFIKLVPDCILPQDKRRTRFCDGDEGSDAGSVRRYRLELPEEKGAGCSAEECKRGFLRRWIGVGKASA